MKKWRFTKASGYLLIVIFIMSGCNLPDKIPSNSANVQPTSIITKNISVPTSNANTQSTVVIAQTSTVPPIDQPIDNGGMQIRFVNVIDGGTIQATMANSTSDNAIRPVVILKMEVTGGIPIDLTLNVNGMTALDESNHVSESINKGKETPFTGELHWSPINGGGDYTLVVTAMDDNKQLSMATIHVTVTGIPKYTPTPPPLEKANAIKRMMEIIQEVYNVKIPDPSIQRFDFPNLPNRSRWIAAVYYKGERYYIELFDDTHYELSPEGYAYGIQSGKQNMFTICRPAGDYKILVVFVDYGNLQIDKAEALAQVPVYANWTNELYDNFARSQGFQTSPLHIKADAAWISPPPAPGELLTSHEIMSATGIDPSNYNFTIEIDLDRANTVGTSQWKGILEQGGGIALQGCGAMTDGDVNIFSGVQATEQTQAEVHGVLSMDFNHELGHLFGMMDSWPFSPGTITSPDGKIHDDWIPYVMFGWTDTDGDGIPEIIDPTPYGTSGPQP
jgi:hypothetical protein